jgi:hypothetical protein
MNTILHTAIFLEGHLVRGRTGGIGRDFNPGQRLAFRDQPSIDKQFYRLLVLDEPSSVFRLWFIRGITGTCVLRCVLRPASCADQTPRISSTVVVLKS